MSAANRHRGEVALALGDEMLTLRLTLAALAELETAFGTAGLGALGQRLAAGSPSAVDLIRLLGSAVRGGGQRLGDDAIANLIGAADLPAVAEALSDLFSLSFGAPANPRGPQEG